MNKAILDHWSIMHFAIGLLLGVLFAKFLKKEYAMLIALALLIAWEFFENFTFHGNWGFIYFREESLLNMISDVIVGFIGFLVTFNWLK
ncbi:hypothetical protein HZA33_03800 [Candidatus Pacearchaeota archaeon]|nr:hypothetical protein [Candidatus Pacearchaeota archaeon]